MGYRRQFIYIRDSECIAAFWTFNSRFISVRLYYLAEANYSYSDTRSNTKEFTPIRLLSCLLFIQLLGFEKILFLGGCQSDARLLS